VEGDHLEDEDRICEDEIKDTVVCACVMHGQSSIPSRASELNVVNERPLQRPYERKYTK
jgi:hypothetical protein